MMMLAYGESRRQTSLFFFSLPHPSRCFRLFSCSLLRILKLNSSPTEQHTHIIYVSLFHFHRVFRNRKKVIIFCIFFFCNEWMMKKNRCKNLCCMLYRLRKKLCKTLQHFLNLAIGSDFHDMRDFCATHKHRHFIFFY